VIGEVLLYDRETVRCCAELLNCCCRIKLCDWAASWPASMLQDARREAAVGLLLLLLLSGLLYLGHFLLHIGPLHWLLDGPLQVNARLLHGEQQVAAVGSNA
ncbi:hypothetical protein Dimus_033164, partial [Dionaea muscipula]